jgi:hypothetical protein
LAFDGRLRGRTVLAYRDSQSYRDNCALQRDYWGAPRAISLALDWKLCIHRCERWEVNEIVNFRSA